MSVTVLFVVVGCGGQVTTADTDAPTSTATSAVKNDCSLMAEYDPNFDVSTNGAATSGIHDSPTTAVENERRLAQEDVEVWASEAAAADSTSVTEQAEAHQVKARAQVDFFDSVLSGEAQRTDDPGKVTFVTSSPDAWIEIVEDSGYWYVTGLSISPLPEKACT